MMISAGRKFWLAVGFELLVCLFFSAGTLDQAGFIEISKFALGGYLGANVLHYAVERGVTIMAGKQE